MLEEPSLPPFTRPVGVLLADRNFRHFFLGQLVSVSGTWLQNVAQAWLVLRLTGSGSALGVIAALQALPFVVAAPYGGLIADRVDRRKLLLAVQTASAILAAALAVLTAAGLITVVQIATLAFATGCVNALEIPARQSFLNEVVGREQLAAAIPLTNVVANGGRLIGPAVAALLISTVGIASCFALNSLSYVAIIVALARIRRADLHPSSVVPRGPGQLTEGLRYAWREPVIRRTLITVAAVGTAAWQFPVVLPLMAKFTFQEGAGWYGAMAASMATGAVLGGLQISRSAGASPRPLPGRALALGVSMLAVAAAPSVQLACGLLVVTGAASVHFAATANTAVQLATSDPMRGRVMALFTVAFTGTTLVGGPLVGTLSDLLGARTGLALGGAVALASGLQAVLVRAPAPAGAR